MKILIGAVLLCAIVQACAITKGETIPCNGNSNTAIESLTPKPRKESFVKPDSDVSHLCGAKTKSGGTCKRHVKGNGTDYCWMHKDQQPEEK